MNKHETFRGATVSLSHLTEEENSAMTAASGEPCTELPLPVYHNEHGYIVRAMRSVASYEKLAERDLSGWTHGRNWPGLSAICKWAAKHGYEYVMLDGTADTIDELPTYEW